MIRSLILLLNMVGVLFINVFLSEDVTLTVVVPTTVRAGSEFNVEVTLKKGSVDGFARFQQELPNGLTASVIDPAQGNFTFEDQKIKFIWLRLPTEKEVKLSYRIKVDERLKGNFQMKGLFSYIEGNERKTVKIDEQIISIAPSSQIDPSLIVDINEFQQMIPVQPPISLATSSVRCIRQQPYPAGEGNDLMVNLLVNKGATEKFAKIEEEIPRGFKAEAVQARDAIFTFKDQKAKFLWMNLPPQPRFVVSYRLIPEDGMGEAKVTITGKFSYIVNEATRVIDIVQRQLDLTNLDPSHLDGIIASLQTYPGEGGTLTSSFTGADGGIEIPIEYKKIEDKPKRVAKPQFDMMAYKLEPEKGIYYRVQIAAGHKPIDIKKYFKRYNISEEVRTEEHKGWWKYSIGSFYEYKEARDYRMILWNTTRINDAFVAAYNNGVRITVQEALMISNQKWYR